MTLYSKDIFDNLADEILLPLQQDDAVPIALTLRELWDTLAGQSGAKRAGRYNAVHLLRLCTDRVLLRLRKEKSCNLAEVKDLVRAIDALFPARLFDIDILRALNNRTRIHQPDYTPKPSRELKVQRRPRRRSKAVRIPRRVARRALLEGTKAGTRLAQADARKMAREEIAAHEEWLEGHEAREAWEAQDGGIEE